MENYSRVTSEKMVGCARRNKIWWNQNIIRLETALYYTLGNLPVPEFAPRFF